MGRKAQATKSKPQKPSHPMRLNVVVSNGVDNSRLFLIADIRHPNNVHAKKAPLLVDAPLNIR